jgi:DMSO reductase family type II enzyme heme b subunit
LADPAAPAWSAAESVTVALGAVPLDEQPTEYIQVAWADRPYASVREADVAAAHDGTNLWVRISWADPGGESREFPDGAAVAFPCSADGAPATMGSADAPVDLWCWHESRTDARRVVSRGPGVLGAADADGLAAGGVSADGRWTVTLGAPLASIGDTSRLGVVVWNGANEERAGLGAVSDWVALEGMDVEVSR